MLNLIPLLKIIKAVDGEISQAGNLNAYSRLLRLPQFGQVAKVYTSNEEQWRKNLANLELICGQISQEDIPKLTLPTALLEYQNDVVGYLMPYIEGNTLDEVISCKLKPRADIISAFNQVASVINRLPTNVHIGDLHQRNIIVSYDGKISLIDIDGFSVDNGYFLTCPMSCDRFNFETIPKHKYFRDDNTVRIGKNTDIYCLLEMFFTWILDGLSPFLFSKKRFIQFCKYLAIKGISVKTVGALNRVSEAEDNFLTHLPFEDFKSVESISYDDFISVMGLADNESKYHAYINKLIREARHGAEVL